MAAAGARVSPPVAWEGGDAREVPYDGSPCFFYLCLQQRIRSFLSCKECCLIIRGRRKMTCGHIDGAILILLHSSTS